MDDEGRTNEPDDDVLDLTKIKHDRARKQRDSDRSAHRKAAAERSRGRDQHPSQEKGEASREAGDPQDALDREQVELDRQQTELDQDQNALERSARGAPDSREGDREQSGLDREQAALDREQARLDRAQATLQREGTRRQDYLIDDLTGTLRRGPGLLELQHEIERARRERAPLVVAFVDVDNLKAVNDRQGHAAGDQLLREVAEGLRRGLRSYDLILRYGGDEFVCALSNTEIDRARRRLREVADILGAGRSHGSISWGLAELQAGDSLDDVVARADFDLYETRRA